MCFSLSLEFYLSDLKEVVGYQSFPLESLVTKGGMRENEEGDFDELGQLFLNNNVNHPGGDSFIEKDALRLTPSVPGQQTIQGTASNLEKNCVKLTLFDNFAQTSLNITGVWPGTEKYSLPLLRLGPWNFCVH